MPPAQHPKQYLFQQLGTSVWGSLEKDRECRWSHLRQGDSFDGATGKRSGMLMESLEAGRQFRRVYWKKIWNADGVTCAASWDIVSHRKI